MLMYKRVSDTEPVINVKKREENTRERDMQQLVSFVPYYRTF